jgi:hypothetical protein
MLVCRSLREFKSLTAFGRPLGIEEVAYSFFGDRFRFL